MGNASDHGNLGKETNELRGHRTIVLLGTKEIKFYILIESMLALLNVLFYYLILLFSKIM